jgi:hypothetical protein
MQISNSNATMSTTAATSKLLSTIQHNEVNRGEASSAMSSASHQPTGVSRTMRMEAKIAAENAKKKTVP